MTIPAPVYETTPRPWHGRPSALAWTSMLGPLVYGAFFFIPETLAPPTEVAVVLGLGFYALALRAAFIAGSDVYRRRTPHAKADLWLALFALAFPAIAYALALALFIATWDT